MHFAHLRNSRVASPSFSLHADSSVAAGYRIARTFAGTTSPTTATRASKTYKEANASGVISLAEINDDNFPVDTIIDSNSRSFTGVRNWPSETNLVDYSWDIDSWSKSGVTCPASSQASPDSSRNMKIVHEDSSTGAHRINRTYSIAADTTVCLSGYAKAINRDRFRVLWQNTTDGTDLVARFNLTSGVEEIGDANNTTGITHIGNNIYLWWSVYHNVTAMSRPLFINLHNGSGYDYTGGDQDSIYISDIQLEYSKYPTQRIYTNGASASRDAGTLIYPAINNIPNTKQGTLAGKFWHPNFLPSADTTIFEVTDGGSASDRVRFYFDTSGYLNVDIDHSGGTTRTLQHAVNVCNDVVHDYHVSYQAGRAILSVDRTIRAINTDIVAADIPDDLDQIAHAASYAVIDRPQFIPHPTIWSGVL